MPQIRPYNVQVLQIHILRDVQRM